MPSSKDVLISAWRSIGVSERILSSFKKVPREIFVPKNLVSHAYDDVALPILNNQTISQPTTIINMLSLLDVKNRDNVLEVGTGSGYTSAILSNLCHRVTSIEIDPHIASIAIKNVKKLDIKNVKIIVGNGKNGYKKNSPYDKVLINACSDTIPSKIVEQLNDGGVIVVPIGTPRRSVMNKCVKINNVLKCSEHGLYSFVPLI